MNNGPSPTPEQNAQDIAALTSAVNSLVSQFIRPNAQQANANREVLDSVVDVLRRQAEAIAQVDIRLERIADQQEANTQQIAAIGDRLEQFDQRLEETRAIVAENSSQIAQLNVKIDEFVEESKAVRETMQTQLTAIISNARRIDRLEQKAS